MQHAILCARSASEWGVWGLYHTVWVLFTDYEEFYWKCATTDGEYFGYWFREQCSFKKLLDIRRLDRLVFKPNLRPNNPDILHDRHHFPVLRALHVLVWGVKVYLPLLDEPWAPPLPKRVWFSRNVWLPRLLLWEEANGRQRWLERVCTNHQAVCPVAKQCPWREVYAESIGD